MLDFWANHVKTTSSHDIMQQLFAQWTCCGLGLALVELIRVATPVSNDLLGRCRSEGPNVRLDGC